MSQPSRPEEKRSHRTVGQLPRDAQPGAGRCCRHVGSRWGPRGAGRPAGPARLTGRQLISQLIAAAAAASLSDREAGKSSSRTVRQKGQRGCQLEQAGSIYHRATDLSSARRQDELRPGGEAIVRRSQLEGRHQPLVVCPQRHGRPGQRVGARVSHLFLYVVIRAHGHMRFFLWKTTSKERKRTRNAKNRKCPALVVICNLFLPSISIFLTVVTLDWQKETSDKHSRNIYI